jgi:hypothetical protein
LLTHSYQLRAFQYERSSGSSILPLEHPWLLSFEIPRIAKFPDGNGST